MINFKNYMKNNHNHFNLPGAQELGAPQQPEMSKRATSGAPESAIETNRQVSEYEARYNELVRAHSDNDYEAGKAITLGCIMSEGVQTLVNEYGNEYFFNVIRQLKASGAETPTTLDVIVQLEPDSRKRNELYARIESDAQAEHMTYDAWEQRTDRDETRYHRYGARDANSLQETQLRVMNYRSLESFLGKFTDHAGRLFLKIGGARSMRDLVSLPDNELDALQKRLAELENDFSRLTAEIGYSVDKCTDHLHSEAEALSDELSQEIKRISDEANAELEEWRAKIIGDLGKVKGLYTESDEMRASIRDALQNVEKDIAARAKAVATQIHSDTAPLIDLKRQVECLNYPA